MKKTSAPRRRNSKKSSSIAPVAVSSVVIADIRPCLDCGAYAPKGILGEDFIVEADIFKDGHDKIFAVLEWRVAQGEWQSVPMQALDNDRWRGAFPLPALGFTEYRITAWGDAFLSWRHEIQVKTQAGILDQSTEILEGAGIVDAAASRATLPGDAECLRGFSERIRKADASSVGGLASASELIALMRACPDRSLATSSRPLRVWVDRPRAGFSAWYEFFPRSAEGLPDRGSTFRDCLPRIDDARAMGFDVIYFPPVHPIGLTKRKGRNNSLTCEPGDPGVPYAIGNRRVGVNGGGHKDVAPELGTLEDFDWLVAETRARGMEIALDFAINCSPDHPYVHDHPEWFHQRPDGTIKFAENPPKKYEDVYPLNFHNADWRSLWQELREVIAFWCRRHVRIFRVDNPHTKPVAFWEWIIADIQREFPDVIFLSEAFTRPKMMQTLAKAGFTQSYTYFTWRNTKPEITEYLNELTTSEMREYFRPHFFTNTPDILPEILQTGGRPAFLIRAVLAATLSPLFGIYSGFELCENVPIPGREEYLDSEKYHFRARDWNAPGNIKDFLRRLNTLRHDHRAFQKLSNLRFLEVENDQMVFYVKSDPQGSDVFVAVTLDPHHPQTAFAHLPIEEYGLSQDEGYRVEDLLTGEIFSWKGSRNYIALDPQQRPAHILRILPTGLPQ